MATIQKIRSYGVVLICIVGIALFAFIAEELVRAVSSTRNAGRQVIGEVYGENVNYQEFNDLYDEYENAVKMGNGGQNLTEMQAAQLRDQVWENYVSQKAIEHEAEALGITVTDAEVQNLIRTGASPVLRQTPFVNQQTGAFDSNMLDQFLNNYKEMKNNPDVDPAQMEQIEQYMKYWKFIEKQVRQQALAQKYQALLASCITTNSVNAKAAFDARTNVSTALVAALPYTTIKDTDIKPSDSDLKAKYEELKKQFPDMFRMPQETRDIKYILVPVTASQKDQQDLQKELSEYATALADTGSIANIIRESRSTVAYNGIAISKTALPTDVASEIDSIAVGTIKGPYVNAADNSMNVIKYIAKVQTPDSVEFARIDIPGTDEKATKTADSIFAALNAGDSIQNIAKKYNQSGAPQWVTSMQVDHAQLNDESRDFVNTLFTTPAKTTKKVTTSTGTIIIQVTDTRNNIDKYNVAVIKRSIDFSDETHEKTWNKFSSFLSANHSIESIEANAVKNGYIVKSDEFVSSSSHYVAQTPGTTEALRWIFDKAEKGDVSDLYECGTSNDQLLVVMVTDVHEKGTIGLESSRVKEFVEQEVIKDKKAEQLIAKINGAKSVAEVAKIQGAVQDTLSAVTFSAPVFVQKTSSSEPVLSGAISACKKGTFKTAVRGEAGVFAFQVLDQQAQQGVKFDKKQEKATLQNTYMSGLRNFMGELINKAEVEDNRYKFYQ